MTEEQIQEFVRDLVSGRIMTSHFVLKEAPDLIEMVFAPIMFGAMEQFDLETVSCLYERIEKAGPRGVHGFPMFLSMQVCHVDDWKIIAERAEKAFNALDAAVKGDE